tara:strand:- start:3126 stop:4529 length:1404 start_codon:yes stop_codon:yes gene_type:complete
MTLENVIDENHLSIPYNLNKQIQIIESNNQKQDVEIFWEGFNFKFIFYWKDSVLHHDILIDHSKPSSHIELILDFDSNYKRIWSKYINQEFKIGSVSITKSRKTNTNFIDISFKNNLKDIILSIDNLICDLLVNGAKEVIIKKSNCKNIIIQNVDNLDLEDIRSTTEDSTLTTENIRILKLRDSALYNWKLTGKIMSTHSYNSKIKHLNITEANFNQIEFEKTTITNCTIENSNLDGYFGQIRFKDSNIDSLLDLREIIVRGHSKLFLKKLNIFSNTENQIHFWIADRIFNPKIVFANDVKWFYDGISSNKVYPEGKRKLINSFKNFYNSIDEIHNSQLFYSFEKKWYWENNTYNFPLSMARYSNNFGLSLVQPLIGLMILIFLQALILIMLAGDCSYILIEKYGVFAHLINPTHKTDIFIEVFDSSCIPSLKYSNMLPFIDNIFRITIVYMIFQFANAFRYKYKLR